VDYVPTCSPLASNPGMRGYRFGGSADASPLVVTALRHCGPRPAAPATPAAPAKPAAPATPAAPAVTPAATQAAQAEPVAPARPKLPEGVTDHLGQRIMPDWSRHISLAFCHERPAGGFPRPTTFRSWCGDTCPACREADRLHRGAYYGDEFDPILTRYAEARAVLAPEEAAHAAAEAARREAEHAAENARREAERAVQRARARAEAVARDAAEALAARERDATERIRAAKAAIAAARVRIRAAQGKAPLPDRPAPPERVAGTPQERVATLEARALAYEQQVARTQARARATEAKVRARGGSVAPPVLTLVHATPQPERPPRWARWPPRRKRRKRHLVGARPRAQNRLMRARGRGRPLPSGPFGSGVLLGVMLIACLLAALPARAAESPPVTSARATATLVTDTDRVQPGAPFHAGLRLQMAPGWHTYWVNPGDAGTAPGLTLALPQGAKASDIAWPAPERLQEGPVVTYSYEHELLLPVTITPPIGTPPIGTPAADATGPFHLSAHANWLVCEKICVPEEGSFTLDLPRGPPAPSAEAPLFAAAAARMPRPSPFDARIAPDGTLAVTGPGLDQASVASATFFPDTWGPIDQSAPETLAYLPDGIALHLKPGQAFKPDAVVSGLLTLRDPAGRASYYSIAAKPGAAPAAFDTTAAAEAGPLGWPRALLFALLGGLILNLMPCVFPVLAMKAVALARMSGAERSHARAGAWAYLAGVVLSFAGLGGTLAAARAAGSAAGWGFQFQSPAFVAAIALVLFAIGLNLSGVFSIDGGRVAGAGQSLASRGGYAGDFFTGVLAVVVATPCTAPFMAAAIAAALAAPLWALLGIFMLMGVGLALPYVLLAEVPAVARRLPRPGPWMEVLRGVLAFPMYGASAWLVWVLSQQAGAQGLLAVLAALVLVAFAAWAFRLSASFPGAGRWLVRAAAGIAVAGCVALIAVLSQLAPPAVAQAAEAGVEAYTPARLAALRAEGRPVFVNMTAAWCVTCLVNERVALSPEPVREAFASRHVAYLKGDWTRQDPAISAFLRAWSRDGVPLYLFYPPGAAQPEVLPQILTERTVLDALDRAGS